MEFTETELAAILDDTSKEIVGDIRWSEDEDHSPSVEFRVEIVSQGGYPLFLRRSFNPLAETLTFAIIHASSRRIYALDMGKDHHNPDCRNVGEKHKHRWTDRFRDKEAYVPADVTAPAVNPVAVWQQFCTEAKINHRGVMHAPPPQQGGVVLMDQPCTLIQRQMGELFQCAKVGRFIRIRTPFMYPDGDYIDLFWKESRDVVTLTDLGETIRWLKMQTISLRRSPKQNQMIEDIRLTHGVEFYRGMLQVRYKADENLAAAVSRLAQAALRTADLWFTFRNRTVASVTDEIADLFRERSIPFEQNVNQVGRSGRSWPINFYIRTPKRSSLVHVLNTGNRGATRRITEHVVATWYDLSHLKVGPESLHFVSLFDDTMDVWSPEDFRQLEDLSDIARWSEPDGLLRLLEAA